MAKYPIWKKINIKVTLIGKANNFYVSLILIWGHMWHVSSETPNYYMSVRVHDNNALKYDIFNKYGNNHYVLYL